MLKKIKDWFHKRYYLYEFRTSSVPTFSARKFASEFIVAGLFVFVFIGLIVYAYSRTEVSERRTSTLQQSLRGEDSRLRSPGPKVISFQDETPWHRHDYYRGYYPEMRPYVVRSSGSLAKVKLLNTVEVYQRVPVFAQITDYGFGKNFFGKTLVGEATPMGGINRVRIDFLTLRLSGSESVPLYAQALSVDGSFGVAAEKKESLIDRGIIGTVREGLTNRIDQRRFPGGANTLESFMLGALLRGFQTELRSDLESDYNRVTVLRLRPNQRFMVQLVEDLEIDQR